MAEIDIPPYFLCPISLSIMQDPVTISTGITYDRNSIENWIFRRKNNTCPVTKHPLPAPDLTPNTTLRRLIQSWCTLHSTARLPTPKAPATKPQILKLLNDVETPEMQLKSLQKLKSISSENQSNKRFMENLGAHNFLASLISKKKTLISISEEALAILYSLQLSESGLKTLTNDEFIDCLTGFIQFGPGYESRAYAVMLLKSIFEVVEPTQLVNIKPVFFFGLAEIMKDQISPKATKSTLKILTTVCANGRNRIKAVESGIVSIMIDFLLDSSDKRSCEMALMVLDYLSQCAEGRADLLQHGAGLAVVAKKILRVSQAASERGVRILYSISRFSGTAVVVQEMLQVGAVAKMCLVLQVECGMKTKERVREMLKLHARVWKSSSCIPNSLISSYP